MKIANIKSALLCTSLALVLIAGLETIGWSHGQARQGGVTPAKPPAGIVSLLEKSGYTYSKVSDGVYEIPASGKNAGDFAIRIAVADELFVFIAPYSARKNVALKEPLIRTLLELNDNYDVVKFALSADMLYARIDARSRGVDGDELKYLIELMVEVYDAAYPKVKPYLTPEK